VCVKIDSYGLHVLAFFGPFLTKMQFVRGRNPQKAAVLNQFVHLNGIQHAFFDRFFRKMAYFCSSIKKVIDEQAGIEQLSIFGHFSTQSERCIWHVQGYK